MTKQPRYWANGRIVAADKATVNIRDLGFARGYAVFESIRTYGGVPFQLQAHLDRLAASAEVLALRLPLSLRAFAEAVHKTLEANKFDESLVRLYVTGGESSTMLPEGVASAFIAVDPLHEFPDWQYEKGIHLGLTSLARTLPEAKSTGYLAAVVATLDGKRNGMDEIAFVDAKGAILEGTTFSVLAVVGKTLITPRQGVLPGVTCTIVEELARHARMTVTIRSITKADIAKASELFITSSNREIIPVTKLEGKKIGSGKPGPVTRSLLNTYRMLALTACAERVQKPSLPRKKNKK